MTAESTNSSKVDSTVDREMGNNLRRRHLRGDAGGVGVTEATDTHAVEIEVRDINVSFLVE
jgi:hypothetical protein